MLEIVRQYKMLAVEEFLLQPQPKFLEVSDFSFLNSVRALA